MAGSIQGGTNYSGATLYAIIRNSSGEVWNTNSEAFEAYNGSNLGDYDVPMTEQGSSGYFAVDFPTAITEAAEYSVVSYQQAGGSPASTDKMRLSGTIPWNGTEVVGAVSDLTSDALSSINDVAGCAIIKKQRTMP